MRAGVRSIEHGSYLDDEGIALMKKHGTWLVADIYNGDYIEDGRPPRRLVRGDPAQEPRDHRPQRDGFRKAVQGRRATSATAPTAASTRTARTRASSPTWCATGMTPMQAIQSATIERGALARARSELGSIAPGKSADLIAVAGDPLADIDVLRQVRGGDRAGHGWSVRDGEPLRGSRHADGG